MQHAFAFASRMVTRAIGALGQSNPGSLTMRQGWLMNHFKTADPEKLTQVIDRYQAVYKALKRANQF